VGFNGYPHDYVNHSNFIENNTQSNSLGLILDTQLDVQGPMLLRGIEWVYSWLESAIAHSATILYESNFIATDISKIENIIWAYDQKLSFYIFLCIIYDLHVTSNMALLPHIDNWYNYLHIAANNIVFHLEHPEHNFLYHSAVIDFVFPYITKIKFLIELELTTEGIILIPFVILDVIWKITLFGIFLSFLMHWYSVSVNDNNIDSDFLINSLSIESEEEIASIDDTVLLLVIIFFIFGWFFFFNYLNILTFLGEVIFIFIFLPILLYIMFFIPIFLLFDYGMYFITYLRGAGSSASLVMEFIYDCIAFLAFFIRLSVQNVRLLLITLTFFSLYEFILFFVNVNWFNPNFEPLNNLNSNSISTQPSYYYFIYTVNKLIYWVYELLHTFFVTVAQFVAFFAMVFWLFLFLYTMFVVEEFEKYLDDKRQNLKSKNIK
jgi:hypothetical protein